MCLARRGVDVLVAEVRERGEPPSAKSNHVSSRSMEIFRQLGIAAAVRNCGLPPDFCNDVAYRTTTTGIELGRIAIPCRRDRFTEKSGPDGWWPTPEPPHRVNQIFWEPILAECAAADPRITLLNELQVDGLRQDEDRVIADATDLRSGEKRQLESQFLVGCDGGGSIVRREIGAKLEGDAMIQRVQSTYFRAPALLGLISS